MKYAADSIGCVTSRTIRKIKHNLNRWQRFALPMSATAISTDHFAELRRRCKLSPRTVEGTIDDVLLLLRWASSAGLLAEVPKVGRRLKRPTPNLEIPTIEQLSAVYDATFEHVPAWPRIPNVPASAWWRCWLTVSYFTALRLGDLLALRQSSVTAESITVHTEKPDKTLMIPMHSVLGRHLSIFTGAESAEPCRTNHVPFATVARFAVSAKRAWRLFGVGASLKQIRRELRALCKAADVRPLTMQSIRRLSANEYERAERGAGAAILGHSAKRTATTFYLDRSAVNWELLKRASRKLRVPDSMLLDSERNATANLEPDMLEAFRRLPESDRRRLITIAESFNAAS